MGISIEIDSNKRMKKDYIKSFKLTFKDKDLEKKVKLDTRPLDLVVADCCRVPISHIPLLDKVLYKESGGC